MNVIAKKDFISPVFGNVTKNKVLLNFPENLIAAYVEQGLIFEPKGETKKTASKKPLKATSKKKTK